MVKDVGQHLAGMETWEWVILGAFRSVVFEHLRMDDPALARLVAEAVPAIPDIVREADPSHADRFAEDLTPAERRRWEAALLDLMRLTLRYGERLSVEEIVAAFRPGAGGAGTAEGPEDAPTGKRG